MTAEEKRFDRLYFDAKSKVEDEFCVADERAAQWRRSARNSRRRPADRM